MTADDVAELAGVSRWTVNRAFKKDASISAGSREKVLEAASVLGYFPDVLASSLASDRSDLVSLLVDDFANPHKLVMIENLSRIPREAGWVTLLVNTLDGDDASMALQHASQRRVDAAVPNTCSIGGTSVRCFSPAHKPPRLICFARRLS